MQIYSETCGEGMRPMQGRGRTADQDLLGQGSVPELLHHRR